ncbi:hypothetical protein ANTQUA_LOCUS2097 [Anthophora quadrimaculata]
MQTWLTLSKLEQVDITTPQDLSACPLKLNRLRLSKIIRVEIQSCFLTLSSLCTKETEFHCIMKSTCH